MVVEVVEIFSVLVSRLNSGFTNCELFSRRRDWQKKTFKI
jgi:hypothetical protein